ncbi:unnamed protein product, partial [Brenthis ino]
MVVKVYISGISGNKEVKKRQQRVLMILDSKNIKYEIIDITEPGKEDDKDFMQNNSKSNGGTVSDPNPRTPLPPQVFNDDEYCGDYDQFDLANEVDTLEQFLKVEVPAEEPQTENKVNAVNGVLQNNQEENDSKEKSQERDSAEVIENSEKEQEAPSDNGHLKETSSEIEASVEKEISPVRQTSTEKDEAPANENDKPIETEIESKQISEENESAPEEAIENGSVSSRDPSVEKNQVNEQSVDKLSEALIESEKLASEE